MTAVEIGWCEGSSEFDNNHSELVIMFRKESRIESKKIYLFIYISDWRRREGRSFVVTLLLSI